MTRFFIFLLLISALIFVSCKQNGELSKEKSREFEEVSKEIDLLEKGSANDSQNSNPQTTAPVYGIKVKKVFPHDSTAYTQGLFFHKGFLYESTGLIGKSSLRKIEPESGKILKMLKIKGGYFAEGIEIYNDMIYQLTWISQTCFVYNPETFNLINSISYIGEGWGLTKLNNRLVISDGSSKLKIVNPENFNLLKEIEVMDGNIPVYNLNELEIIEGEIWANVYLTKKIARINPESGKVNSWIDLSSLYSYLSYNETPDVLNGIAYDSKDNRIFVTGKLWKLVFEIEVNQN